MRPAVNSKCYVTAAAAAAAQERPPSGCCAAECSEAQFDIIVIDPPPPQRQGLVPAFSDELLQLAAAAARLLSSGGRLVVVESSRFLSLQQLLQILTDAVNAAGRTGGTAAEGAVHQQARQQRRCISRGCCALHTSPVSCRYTFTYTYICIYIFLRSEQHNYDCVVCIGNWISFGIGNKGCSAAACCCRCAV